MSFFSSLDTAFLHSLFASRAMPTTVFFIGVTELGSVITIGGLTACVALVLALRRHFAELVGLLFCMGSSIILVTALKYLVHRPRPDILFQAYHGETGYSFPSAHATLAFAFYGFLIFMFYQSEATVLRKRVMAVAGAIIILAIGLSRLYLGVHYLSDVIGGYLLGAACLWLAAWTTRMLENR